MDALSNHMQTQIAQTQQDQAAALAEVDLKMSQVRHVESSSGQWKPWLWICRVKQKKMPTLK